MGGDFPPMEPHYTKGNDYFGEDGLNEEEDENSSFTDEDSDYLMEFEEDYFDDNDEKVLNGRDKVAIAQLLLKKGKKCAAQYLKWECIQNQAQLKENILPNMALRELLDILINPDVSIGNEESYEWIKWLISSGETPMAFYKRSKLS